MLAFYFLSIGAIACAGLLSAFAAQRPNRVRSWVVGYLVLVVGLLQLGIAASASRLEVDLGFLFYLGMILFNIGNLSVIVGRFYKYKFNSSTSLIVIGTAFIGIGVIDLTTFAGQSTVFWPKIAYLCLLVILLASAIAGMSLFIRSIRSQKKT